MNLPGQRIKLCDPIDLISEKLHPDRILKGRYRNDLQHIALHPESTTPKIHIISHVLNIDQLPDHIIPVLVHTRAQRNHHFPVIIRITNPIDTGYRRYYDHIPPLNQCSSRTVSQLIDFIIDCRILRNIGICRWHICLRLIIIIIGNKILHRIMWEECLKLTV